MADKENADGTTSGDAVVDLEAGAQGDTNSEEMDTVDLKDQVSMDLKKQVLQNPQVLAALQDRLDSLVGQRSGYIDLLPPAVKRRIKALKNYQVKQIQLEAKFYEEVHQLECKYAKMYDESYEKRKGVITGEVEPTDSDCEWESSEDEDDEDEDAGGDGKEVKALAEQVKNKINIVDDDNTKGIPEFWLTIFKNVDLTAEMIQDHDEPIMKHLDDIRVILHEGPDMGFTLEFYFTPNEFFTNKVLTKKYQMKSEPDESDPFSYEGPEIVGAKGCKIDWKKGKDITVKVIKKKQKHKGRGQTRVVTKTVMNDSFFNFFKPPEIPEDETEMDDETESLLAADFEIGHMIRERIVPRAVLYFTGEAIDDDEYEEEGEEEEGEGEDEEDEENDPDFDPSKEKPPECKSQ